MATTQSHFGANIAGNSASLGAGFETYRGAEVTALATLVADGAVPTQTHVNTVNADHTSTLLGLANDFNVIVDTTKIDTMDKYRKMSRRSEQYFAGMLKGP
jgi:hypothetical protein